MGYESLKDNIETFGRICKEGSYYALSTLRLCWRSLMLTCCPGLSLPAPLLLLNRTVTFQRLTLKSCPSSEPSLGDPSLGHVRQTRAMLIQSGSIRGVYPSGDCHTDFCAEVHSRVQNSHLTSFPWPHKQPASA